MAELTLRTESKQARYFTERLTDGHDPELGLDMLWIEGGEFTMGSPLDEPGRSDDESPQHQVTVPSFFMGRYPVTQAQWRFVAGLASIQQDLDPAPSKFQGDTHPVEQVSWYDAIEFCARLTAYTGRTYRLPSEAEWEYACRAGTTTPFYFGEILTTEVANFDGTYTYNNSPKGEYRQTTTPVDGFKLANAWGLSDMHGNVYEWCEDHWHGNYAGAPEDGSAWLREEARSNASRVIRGGSWSSEPQYCCSAYRINKSPHYSYDYIGFRVVCASPSPLR